MYKIRDLADKEVYLVNGKKVGMVNGLLIDYNEKKVKTLLVKRFGFFKSKFVSCDNIISISSSIIVSGLSIPIGISIDNIIMKNVYNKNGTLKGNVVDVLINEQSLDLVALVCSKGLFNKIMQGDNIISTNETILGDKYILDISNGYITVSSIIHKVKEGIINENPK